MLLYALLFGCCVFVSLCDVLLRVHVCVCFVYVIIVVCVCVCVYVVVRFYVLV